MNVLRICTWNVWHALSPYGYGVFGPLLMPQLESSKEAQLRRIRQMETLTRLRKSESDIFCLQEINPIEKRRSLVAQELSMRDAAMRCNAGIKWGSMGLPLHLSDGLLTLTGKAFRKRKTVRITLSGKAYEWDTPFGVPLFMQLGERRCALLLETVWKSRKIAVVNLHLHNGTEVSHHHRTRRREELVRLARSLKRRSKDVDLLAVCGDFNCEADSSSMEPLWEIGLIDCAQLSATQQKITWDPQNNPATEISARLATERQDECRGWEDAPHIFDRIYVQAKVPLKKVGLKRVCDEPNLSDHYGVLAELTF
ncbi:MAG: endonuclease/exonuclease/phosphatase family protein [Bdellovibrionia bacterium]